MPALMRFIHGVYLAHDVVVSGDVLLAPEVNLWFGTIIRGDIATITLAERVNIQDGSILHTDFDVPLRIDSGVVVGHGVILHGSSIGRDCLIGMGARLLSGSQIGEESIVAAGSIVTEGKIFPPRSLLMGTPAKVVRQVTDQELAKTRSINHRYLELAKRYAQDQFEFRYGKPTLDSGAPT